MGSSASKKGVRIWRFGLAGALAAVAIFVGLWSVAQLPMGPSDLIVHLSTTRGPSGIAGLREGVFYAALIGFFAGAIIDLAYEALRRLERSERANSSLNDER